MKSVPFTPLEPGSYREIVRRALAEDLGWGDVTTEGTIPAQQRAKGVLLAKASCVVAGLDVALEAFRQLDPSVSVRISRHDGDRCDGRGNDRVACLDSRRDRGGRRCPRAGVWRVV